MSNHHDYTVGEGVSMVYVWHFEHDNEQWVNLQSEDSDSLDMKLADIKKIAEWDGE